MKTYRYPGVRPFQAADQALFFGRDRDIANLYEMVRAERLVVLFGKSGYGKSSLLNAGVLPRLTGVLTPLTFRLGEYIDGQSLPPVETVQRKTPLQQLRPEAAFLQTLPSTLWTHFKQMDSAEKGSYLLVFDQFEEFFTYPPVLQRAFRDQIADLLNGELPEDLYDAAHALDSEQRRLLTVPMDIRVLFAIRSDHLHELDRLKDRLPAILHRCYKLKALSREQAREAIVQPARLATPGAGIPEGAAENPSRITDRPSFFSPPFEYREDALNKILAQLAITDAAQQSGVEAFQLQILCANIENKVAEGLIRDRDSNGLPEVTTEDLPDFTEIFGQYYEQRLAMLPETQRDAARRVIEDGLVRFNPATGEGRRLNMDGQALLKDFEAMGLNAALLRELESTFLVRREPNTLGGHNYELSHDTLLAPVLRSKQRRMAEEAERKRREKLAAEEAREEAEAQRRQRLVLIITFFAGALALVVIAMVYALWMRGKAEKLAEGAINGLLDGARKNIFELRYDNAFSKMKSADKLATLPFIAKSAAVKDTVAFELMEIAFFYYHARRSEKAEMAFSMAAKLLGEPDISTKSDFNDSLAALDKVRYNLLKTRYFPEMVDIESGTFTMGSEDPADCLWCPPKPPHRVTVSGFQMAKTETTVWQYNLYLAALGKDINDTAVIEPPGWGWEGDNPVVNVKWKDAIGYANWLSEKQHPSLTPAVGASGGQFNLITDATGYRLPTEAEWEYAARGGVHGDAFLYSGSDVIGSVAWYKENSGNRTHTVATKKANRAGLFDMSGNAWEWCWDWLGDYPTDPVTDPRGPDNRPYNYTHCKSDKDGESRIDRELRGDSSSIGRVLRGGSSDNDTGDCRVAIRNTYTPGRRRNDDRGFRLARSL